MTPIELAKESKASALDTAPISMAEKLGLGVFLVVVSAILQWGLDLPLSFSWPAHLPMNTIAILAGTYLALNISRKNDYPKIYYVIWTAGVVLFIQWISFPWGNRGAGGWMWYGILSVSATGMVSLQWKSNHPWKLLGHRAFLTTGAGVLMMCCSSITHVTALVAVVVPVVMAGVFYSFKRRTYWPMADMWLLPALALLLANASIRFVEDPQASLPEALILKSIVAIYFVASCFTMAKGPSKTSLFFSLLSMLLCLLAGVWVYTHESEVIDTSPSYNYGG
jgi:hypothetical protein